jgi:Outer membrane protein beta-barrel domain
MNKLIALFLCLFTLSSFGQRNLFDIGIEGGLGTASLRVNDYGSISHHNKIGYETGFFAQYNFKKLISIRIGTYYEKKGSGTKIQVYDDIGNLSGVAQGNESFEYITFPVFVRATFGRKLHYFINAGSYLGFLHKQTLTYGAFRQFPEETFNTTDNYKKTEKGISTGAGVLFNYKQRVDFSIEIRNNLGLTNTSKLPLYNGGEIKTSATNLLLGISYKLGHRNNLKRK